MNNTERLKQKARMLFEQGNRLQALIIIENLCKIDNEVDKNKDLKKQKENNRK